MKKLFIKPLQSATSQQGNFLWKNLHSQTFLQPFLPPSKQSFLSTCLFPELFKNSSSGRQWRKEVWNWNLYVYDSNTLQAILIFNNFCTVLWQYSMLHFNAKKAKKLQIKVEKNLSLIGFHSTLNLTNNLVFSLALTFNYDQQCFDNIQCKTCEEYILCYPFFSSYIIISCISIQNSKCV